MAEKRETREKEERTSRVVSFRRHLQRSLHVLDNWLHSCDHWLRSQARHHVLDCSGDNGVRDVSESVVSEREVRGDRDLSNDRDHGLVLNDRLLLGSRHRLFREKIQSWLDSFTLCRLRRCDVFWGGFGAVLEVLLERVEAQGPVRAPRLRTVDGSESVGARDDVLDAVDREGVLEAVEVVAVLRVRSPTVWDSRAAVDGARHSAG